MSEDRPSGESGPRFEERERRLAELLAEALDVPRERQWAFLRERCSDVEVVREAEALLAAKEGLGNFLSTPAIARVGLTSTQGLDDGSAAGDTDSRFGHFRIEELVGEGGMGRVYRGFQTEPVERQVAIKVVRSALAGPHTARRFANERHALARLNHPNIAQLYEASTTAGGRPYFVMEYVDGPPIHEYCDRWRLGLAERLELFL